MSKIFDNYLSHLEDSDSSGTKNMSVLISTRKNRDMKSIQQAVCIGLLSKHCKLVFKQPSRKATFTQQYLSIQSIQFSEFDVIDLEEFVKRRSTEKYQYDLLHHVPEKTAKRRYEVGKKAEQIHFLQDILLEFGYSFHTYQPNGKNQNRKLTQIISVFNPDGSLLLNDNQIVEFGEMVNQQIQQNMRYCKNDYYLLQEDISSLQM